MKKRLILGIVCILALSLIVLAENASISILPDETSQSNNQPNDIMITFLSLIADKVNTVVGDVIHLEATLTYENSSPITDKEIEFYADQSLSKNRTNSEGRAVIDWDTTNWLPEAYRVSARYTGDEVTSGNSKDIEVILKPKIENTELTKDLTTLDILPLTTVQSSPAEIGNEQYTPSVADGQEVQILTYKYSNTSNIITSTKAEINCAWKPDNIDDGWKTCEAIFDVENQNTIRPLITELTSIFNFRDTTVLNQVITFSNTFNLIPETISREVNTITNSDEATLQTRIQNDTIIRRQYTNFQSIPTTVDTTQPFAIKLTYEAPKYDENQFSMSLSSTNFNAIIDPLQSKCGTLSTSGVYTLTANVSSSGTCFIIGASNIQLNCAGRQIKYATSGITNTYAIDNSAGYDNVNVTNCFIEEGSWNSSTKYAIYFLTADNGTIRNNTIITHGNSSSAIRFASSHNNVVNNNTIRTTGNTSAYSLHVTSSNQNKFFLNSITSSNSSGKGLYCLTCNNNNISFNSINTSGRSSEGMYFDSTSKNNVVHANIITTSGDFGRGISLFLTNNTVVLNNQITTLGSNAQAILVATSSGNNTLENNNLSATSSFELSDTSGSSYINYLVYSNSYGEIRWINNTFLTDLSINGSIGLGTNLFIGENIATLNSSAFSDSFIDSNAIIAFKNLNYSYPRIMRLEDFTTTSSNVLVNGTQCSGLTCQVISAGTNNITFNTTGFSSFAATRMCNNITSKVILTQNMTQNGTCFVIQASNVVIEGAGYRITGNEMGVAVNNTGHRNLTINNTTFFNFSRGIDLIHSFNHSIENNIITTANSSTDRHAILLINVSNSTISGNIIITGANYSTAVRLENGSNTNMIQFNTILITGRVAEGITLQNFSSQNKILYNVINATEKIASGIAVRGSSSYNTILDNNITTIITSSIGVNIENSPSNTISSNLLDTSKGDYAIRLSNSLYSIISGNTISTTNQRAIYSGSSNHSLIASNSINTSGSLGDGIYITNSANNTFLSNSLSITATKPEGIILDVGTDGNYFINNNITTSGSGMEIDDLSGLTTTNYLVYNNTFGEIRWTNTSFLQNLDVNTSHSLGFGLDRTLLIGDNIVTVNVSAFNLRGINSSANITLRRNVNNQSQVWKVEYYTKDSSDILTNGANCEGTSCQVLSLATVNVIFNVSSFGSFAMNVPSEVDVYNLSLLMKNSTYGSFRFFLKNPLSFSNLFNWTFGTGQNTIHSDYNTSLQFNETIIVFVEHDYGIGGIFAVQANGTTAHSYDTEEKTITIG